MYKVKCLKDFGTWIKKGNIINVADYRFFHLERKGIIKKIKYLGNMSYNQYRKNPEYLKQKIKHLKEQLKMFEKLLSNLEG